jgi:RNA polymerase sigma-70 factor (ECF subfamily)
MSEVFLNDLKKHDHDSWSEAFPILWKIAFRCANSASLNLSIEEAKDVAAQAMSDISSCVGKVDSYNGLKALTASISRRKAISFLRKKTAEKRGDANTHSINAINSDGEEFVLQIPANDSDPASDMQVADLIIFVRIFVKTLDGKVGEVIVCVFIEGLSYKEVSDKLNIPVSTVGVYLSRGIQRLRKKIEEQPDLVKQFNELLR